MGGNGEYSNYFQAIGRTKLVSKKKTYGYRERDEARRATFIAELGDGKAAHYVYVDEAGMDHRDDYDSGWSPKGKRLYGVKSGGRKGRINRIAGYQGGKLIAPFTIEGSCNRSVFETWLQTCLIPSLPRGNLVVIDNASFHHEGQIKSLIEAAGCNVM